jgi:hypothetical protein
MKGDTMTDVSGGGAAEERTRFDDEDDEDDLGNVAMSNGIKGLELRVTQERRRRLASSTASSYGLDNGKNAENVINMLCKPTTVASLFDAILPIDSKTNTEKKSGIKGGTQDHVLLLCST